jgi:hypothetical protein
MGIPKTTVDRERKERKSCKLRGITKNKSRNGCGMSDWVKKNSERQGKRNVKNLS